MAYESDSHDDDDDDGIVFIRMNMSEIFLEDIKQSLHLPSSTR